MRRVLLAAAGAVVSGSMRQDWLASSEPAYRRPARRPPPEASTTKAGAQRSRDEKYLARSTHDEDHSLTTALEPADDGSLAAAQVMSIDAVDARFGFVFAEDQLLTLGFNCRVHKPLCDSRSRFRIVINGTTLHPMRPLHDTHMLTQVVQLQLHHSPVPRRISRVIFLSPSGVRTVWKNVTVTRRNPPPKVKISACTMVADMDNRNISTDNVDIIQSWVDYHRWRGIEHIDVYFDHVDKSCATLHARWLDTPSIRAIRWNVPRSERFETQQLMENHCIYSHRTFSPYVFHGDVDEYIGHRHIDTLPTRFNLQKYTALEIPGRFCDARDKCTDRLDDGQVRVRSSPPKLLINTKNTAYISVHQVTTPAKRSLKLSEPPLYHYKGTIDERVRRGFA